MTKIKGKCWGLFDLDGELREVAPYKDWLEKSRDSKKTDWSDCSIREIKFETI